MPKTYWGLLFLLSGIVCVATMYFPFTMYTWIYFIPSYIAFIFSAFKAGLI